MESDREYQSQNKFIEKQSPTGDGGDTRCGLWSFRLNKLQCFASKKTFIILFTASAMLFKAGGTYTNGIISTLEKQYKLSSSKVGIMYALEDFISGIIAILIPYYTSRGHFPRWISFGLILLAMSLFLQSSPYAIYGPGRDALSLTEEFGDEDGLNATFDGLGTKKLNNLCFANKTTSEDCSGEVQSEYRGVTIIIAVASTFAGCGQQFFNTLGMTYLDNNVKRSKIPMFYSLFQFTRMLAPAIGLNVASYFLRFYVAPSLTPTIKNDDPRWIGAWWGGYLIFGSLTLFIVPLMAMLPKVLPRAAMRRREKGLEILVIEEEEKASISDLFVTVKRLVTNKTYFCNTMAAIFYIFGYLPYNYFMTKYLQVQYLLSPSVANSMTGSITFVASAFGLLAAGIIITIYKPRARYMAGWNIVTSLISAIGLITYAFMGCPENNNAMILDNSMELTTCKFDCHCEFVKYSPVCGANNVTFISACHAGCRGEEKLANGAKVFTECSCVDPEFGGSAKPSPCPVDCLNQFHLLLIVLCIVKFISGTETATNFLLGLRCVEDRDKAVSLGLNSAIIKFCAVIPSPIVFGYIFDHACLLWGKTCAKQGNCWLYDTELIKYSFNVTAGVCIIIGMFFDVGTWYYAKDVEIFDEKQPKREER